MPDMDTGTLKIRSRRAMIWQTVEKFFNDGLRVVKLIVLARLLDKQEFGLFGMAMLTLSILNTLSESGIYHTVIYKHQPDKDFLDSAWTFALLRGALQCLVLCLAAGHIAGFFNEPQVGMLLPVLGLSLLADGMSSMGLLCLRKELKFRKLALFNMTKAAAVFGITLFAALRWRNVWALVAGHVVANLVASLGSYGLHHYRPSLRWHRASMRELTGLGKWLMGDSILSFLLREGDDLFLGKMLGTVSLGIYQMAYRISDIPTAVITRMVSRVALPVYSQVNRDLQQVATLASSVLQLMAFFAAPVAVGFWITAPDLVPAVIGEKWAEVIVPLQILAVYSFTCSLEACTGPVFMALGRPDIPFRIHAGKLVLLAALIYPFTRQWGVAGTALSVVIANLAEKPVLDWFTAKTLGIPFHRLAGLQGAYVFSALLMGIALIALRPALSGIGIWPRLILTTGAGILVYASCIVGLEKRMRTLALIRKMLR